MSKIGAPSVFIAVNAPTIGVPGRHPLLLPAILYNLAMAVIDTAGLAYVRRRRTVLAVLAACLWGGLAACLLAVLLSGSRFATMHLAAYGVFFHGPVVLVGSALLLRRPRPRTAVASAAFAVCLILVAVDAFLVEPTWLEVSHVRLATPKVSRSVRIVLLADLQTDHFGPYQREVFERVVLEKPDLILLAGDYLQTDPPGRETLRTRLNDFLRQIELSAPAGVFAVRGNVDWDRWAEIFDRTPITTVERTRSFELPDLRLTCLSRADSFRTSLEIPHADPDRFHLALGHSPDYALGRIDADLLLAGHTHGGQVRLPFIGPALTLSKVPRRWAAGLTELPGGAKLFVSRGVGMERHFAPRLRFLCHPELVVIDLVPE